MAWVCNVDSGATVSTAPSDSIQKTKHDSGMPAPMKLLEPRPERRRQLREEGTTPRSLLRRWVYLVYAVLKFLVIAAVASLSYIFLFGLIIEIGLLTGDAAAIVFIVGFIPLGKLFYAWCFPIQY